MSGIGGLYYLDGRPAERTDLQRMAETLAHRGPDGAGIWHQGAAGLLHRMLWTTPESLQESLPLVRRSGDLAITADARIDNREELAALLDLGRPGEETADSELILAAYKKWGNSCPEKLLGAFCFAIWDGHRGQFFCARDHMGVKPFYYYCSDTLFVFASEIKALLCLPEVPRRLNEERVAYHLWPEFLMEDKSSTFYRGIYRLPPAHSLTVAAKGAQLRAYWSLDPGRELLLGSDDEYAEACREVFTKAVRCRLRSAFPVGTELSGGLDSSSVTCVARKLLAQDADRRLHTFSAIFDEVPQCDESTFIHAVLAQGNLHSHFVHADQMSPLGHRERLMWLEDEPLCFPNTFMHWELFGASQQEGVRVLMDGEDGDGIVSYGFAYLSELAHAGRWTAFAQELQAISDHYDTSPWPYLRQYGLPCLTDLARRCKWAAFYRGAREISKHLDVSGSNLYLNYGLKRLVPEPARQAWRRLRGHNGNATSRESGPANPSIKRSFLRRVGLEERMRELEAARSIPPRTAREDQAHTITSGLHPLGNEHIGKLAATFSIELRHPFYDRRVVEFCLALPPQQKLYKGWTRTVMRRAMDGLLPTEVQWRVRKTGLTANFIVGLLKFERELLDDVIVDDPGSIEDYVDIPVLRESYQRYAARSSTGDAQFVVWPAVTLALWLRHTGLAP